MPVPGTWAYLYISANLNCLRHLPFCAEFVGAVADFVKKRLQSVVDGASQISGAFVTDAILDSVLVTVVVLSLHPNQPGVWQVVVVIVVVVLVIVVIPVVDVFSSKQSHQPGVSHVEVLVLILVEVEELVVLGVELLLS
jgi:hypothetical protein